MLKNLIMKKYWILIHAVFSAAFLIQSFFIVFNILYPSETITTTEEKTMTEIPILFKICFEPAFNTDKLREEGYFGVYHYFLGQSLYYYNSYGWTGHHNGTKVNNNTVKGNTKVT